MISDNAVVSIMAQSWSWGTQAADTKILHVFNWKCHLFYSDFYIKDKGANELEVLQQVLENIYRVTFWLSESLIIFQIFWHLVAKLTLRRYGTSASAAISTSQYADNVLNLEVGIFYFMQKIFEKRTLTKHKN